MAAAPSRRMAPGAPPIVIKKYANRRLYNTATSSYVTLDDLCAMVKDGIEFTAQDAKTGEDITRQVLVQIIVDEEAKGQNLLPTAFMRRLIGFYGDAMQWAVPAYLDYSLKAFAENQERIRDQVSKTMGGLFPFEALKELGKQNWAMLEQAMTTFAAGENAAALSDKTADEMAPATELTELRRRLDELERAIDKAAKG